VPNFTLPTIPTTTSTATPWTVPTVPAGTFNPFDPNAWTQFFQVPGYTAPAAAPAAK
jgi:hypothetical protein